MVNGAINCPDDIIFGGSDVLFVGGGSAGKIAKGRAWARFFVRHFAQQF